MGSASRQEKRTCGWAERGGWMAQRGTVNTGENPWLQNQTQEKQSSGTTIVSGTSQT